MTTLMRDTPGPPPAPVSASAPFAEQGWGRVLRVSVARVVLAFVVSLLVWALVPAVMGWTPRVIMSGSMEPKIVPGDVIVTRTVPPETLVKGQVITVVDPDHPGRTRTHRLLRRDRQGQLVLRGDANRQPDSSHVPVTDVLGLGVLRVPFVGRPMVWLKEHNWLALMTLMLGAGWCLATVLPGSRTSPGNRPSGPRPPRPTRRSRRTRAVTMLTVGVLGATGAGGPADGAFLRTATNPNNTLNAATDFYTYRTSVLADGPYLYWRLAETSGTTAADTSSNSRPGTYSNTPTLGQSGPILAEPKDTAMNSPATAYVTSATSATAPAAFSVEAWVKTTATGGGRLLGLGNAAAGTSSSTTTDRQLYLTPTGKAVFGIGNTKTVLTSTGIVNNGSWHHVVGTYTTGTNGMKLYVDATLVATGTATVNPTLTSGYWRAAAENLASWPTPPTGNYLVGTIDELAVYPTALSATRVQAHFNAATTP